MVRALSIQVVMIFAPRRPQVTGTSDTETKKTQNIFILVTGERVCGTVIHILEPLS